MNTGTKLRRDRASLGILLGAALALAAAWAQAVTDDDTAAVEGRGVTPKLEVSVGYDDNLFRMERAEQSSLKARLSPTVEVANGNDGVELTGVYRGDYGAFASASSENYHDHEVDARARFRTEQTAFTFRAKAAAQTQARGEGPSDGLGEVVIRQLFDDGPFRVVDWSIGGEFAWVFGGGDAMQLALSAEWFDRDYRSYRPITRFRDHDGYRYGARWSNRLSDRVEVLGDLSYTQFSYQHTAVGDEVLDSDELRALFGLNLGTEDWFAGEIRLGYHEKDFDALSRPKASGFTWDVSLRFRPREPDTFDVYTHNHFKETYHFGDAIERSAAGVTWTHQWSDRLHTLLDMGFVREEFESFARNDDAWAVAFELRYALRPSMMLAGGYRFDSRDSSLPVADYDRSRVFLTLMLDW